MSHSMSVAHRLSYVIPEALLVLILFALTRCSGNRTRSTVLALWASTPLMIFTWGQGMPDTWSIVMVLAGWLAVERSLSALPGRAKNNLLIAATACATVGALWTKLLPVLLLPVIALVVVREQNLTARDRLKIGLSGVGLVIVGFVPFMISRPMYVSVFVRFEYDMLENSTAVTLLSAVPAAGFAMVLMAAVGVWALATSRVALHVRAEGLLVGLVLAATLLSGIITHLLVWSLVALVLVARRSMARGIGLHLALSALVMTHLLWYDWLDGLMLDTVAPNIAHDAPWNIVQRVVPMANLLASMVGAIVLVAAGVALSAYWTNAPLASKPQTPAQRRGLVVMALGLPMALLSTLVLSATAAAQNGTASASLSYEYWHANQRRQPTDLEPMQGLLLLQRGAVWNSQPIVAGGAADRIELQLDKKTQFSTDLLRVELVDSAERVLASGEMPIWEAEPSSERWPVAIPLDRTIDEIKGLTVRISRVADGAGPAEAELLLPALTSQKADVNGNPLPPTWGVDLELRHGRGSEAFACTVKALANPLRLLGSVLVALLGLGLASTAVRLRRSPKRLAIPSEIPQSEVEYPQLSKAAK